MFARSSRDGSEIGVRRMRRSWFRLIGLLALVAPLLWGLARAADARRFEANLARATREASAGRFAEAGRWFGSPEAQRSGRPEVAYWLGLCEHAAGRHEAAVAAWGRVPAGSPLAATAELARAQTLVGDLGRFAEAEAILEGLLVVRGPLQPQIRHTLGQLYFWEGARMPCVASSATAGTTPLTTPPSCVITG